MISNNELLKIRAIFQKEFAPYMEYIVEHYINFYVCGSKCYPFITRPHDMDIIITYPESEERRELEPLIPTINKIEKELGYDMMRMCETKPGIWAWLYGYDYINILGSDSLDYDLFKREDRIMPIIKHHYERYMEIDHPKRMYDIIYYYYIIKNGRYFLTDEQSGKVERWHDGDYDWKFFRTIIDELGLEWIEPNPPKKFVKQTGGK